MVRIMSSNEINILKRYFESGCVHVSTYWLECCLEWFKGENAVYTTEHMCSEVMGQWLITDLRDIEVPSLPNHITKHKKYILNGKYAVQIMFVKDISKSSYSQLKTIRDMYKLTRSVTDQESDFSGSGKRVLNLYMTDGVQYINGFEYQPISCLNLHLTPGIKILLIGPLLIRNGEILLKENNIKILGGEVEDLFVSNSVENILARELNLPENPNPGQPQENIEMNGTYNYSNVANNLNSNIATVLSNGNNHNVSNSLININNLDGNYTTFNSEEDDIFLNLGNLDSGRNKIVENNIEMDEKEEEVFTDISITNNFDDNLPKNDNIGIIKDESIDIDIHELEKIENQMYMNQQRNDNYDICEEDELELMERINFEINLNIQNKNTSEKSSQIPVITDNFEPFIYIQHLLKNRDKISHKTFKVKALFLRVIEKLSVNKTKGWTMKFEIMDSTGTIVVDFLSGVIEELMDLSPNEALAENRKVKNKINNSHEKLSEALKNCKEKLESIEYIMHLKFNETDNIPTIVGLERMQKKHLENLKSRVERSNVIL